jgi:uncharacterized membrane protein YGL010W
MIQPSADVLFAEYGAYHTDRRNRLCHEIGIPLIVLAIQALVRAAIPGHTWATFITVALATYYLLLARTRAVAAVIGLFILLAISFVIPWPVAIALFVIGWIFQFVGHTYEGKKPAFLTNLLHLLVGPLWIGHILTTPRSSSSAR